jgi:MFS transporter, FSR family, fosmidomycin resistance protein
MNIIEDKADLNTTEPLPAGPENGRPETFHTAEVVTIAAAHGAHDTYFSFLPTILPLLIRNLALNTTQAGLLSAFTQIPNLVQPVIGHLADRKNLKLLVILAPTFSGIFITLVGVAPTFGAAALLLILAGFSTACFHAIGPAMVSARAGGRLGRGMGFFMVGGELGFAIGPLLVVVVIGALTLKGLPWLMTLGMLASIILFFRLKNVSTVRPAHSAAGLPVRQALAQIGGFMLPIMGSIFITGFLNANVVNYLPTFMASEGTAFALAGASLSILGFSATTGVLVMGLVSDRLGQRNVAFWGTLVSAVFGLGFLLVHGWLQFVMLVGTGMTAFLANPAFLTMVQNRFGQNRALANGLYMSSSFILRSLAVVIVGMLADRFGLRAVFTASTFFSLLALPLILILPKK